MTFDFCVSFIQFRNLYGRLDKFLHRIDARIFFSYEYGNNSDSMVFVVTAHFSLYNKIQKQTVNLELILLFGQRQHISITETKMENKLISNTVIRTGREHELDWARAFAVIFMILVHVFLDGGIFDVEGTIAVVVGYLGGPPAAPVFMFLMGISMVYSRKDTPALMAKRGVGLLIMAYALNIVRDTLPYVILREMGIEWCLSFTDSLLLLDILQLAGLSFLLMALLKKCKASIPIMLAFTLVLQIAGDLLACFTDFSESALRYVLGLFFYTFEYSCFPVMQWFIYPMLGYCFGYLLQRTMDKKRLYTYMFMIGIGYGALTMCSLLVANVDIVSVFMSDAYYSPNLIHHAFYLIAVLIMLPICYSLSSVIKFRPVVSFVNMLSSNVTAIYVMQWVIIEWTLFVMYIVGVEVLPRNGAFLFNVVTLALSAVCAVWYHKIRDRYRLDRKKQGKIC